MTWDAQAVEEAAITLWHHLMGELRAAGVVTATDLPQDFCLPFEDDIENALRAAYDAGVAAESHRRDEEIRLATEIIKALEAGLLRGLLEPSGHFYDCPGVESGIPDQSRCSTACVGIVAAIKEAP